MYTIIFSAYPQLSLGNIPTQRQSRDFCADKINFNIRLSPILICHYSFPEAYFK